MSRGRGSPQMLCFGGDERDAGLRDQLSFRYADCCQGCWNSESTSPEIFRFAGGQPLILVAPHLRKFNGEAKTSRKNLSCTLQIFRVGLVVNIALVGMLAPYAQIGQPSVSKGSLGHLQHAFETHSLSLAWHARPLSSALAAMPYFVLKK